MCLFIVYRRFLIIFNIYIMDLIATFNNYVDRIISSSCEGMKILLLDDETVRLVNVINIGRNDKLLHLPDIFIRP